MSTSPFHTNHIFLPTSNNNSENPLLLSGEQIKDIYNSIVTLEQTTNVNAEINAHYLTLLKGDRITRQKMIADLEKKL